MIKAVIFDIDGTLYDYNSCNAAGIKSLKDKFTDITGVVYSDSDFCDIYDSARCAVKKNIEMSAASHNRLLYVQRLCEQTGCFSAKNALVLYDAYWDAFLDNMHLFDGVYDFLQHLIDNGIKIGICTDLTAHIQFRKLVKLGISDLFDAIVTSEESGAEKPDSRSFFMLLQKLHVEPNEAVMIGDDLLRDMAGAVSVGITPVLFGKTDIRYRHALSYSELSSLFGEFV